MNRKKLFLSVSIVSVVMLIAIVAVVAVLAAGQQTLTSSIKVSYTATDVSAIVSAKCYYVTQTTKQDQGSFTTQGGDTSISFVAGESGDIPKELIPPTNNFELEYGQKIVFEYRFENVSNSTYINAGLTLNEGATNKNMIKTYAYASATELGAADLFNADKTTYDGVAIAPKDDPNGESNIEYLYVILAIDNPSDDAEYSADIKWTLTATNKKHYDDVQTNQDLIYAEEDAGVVKGYKGSASTLILPDTVTGISRDAFKENTTLTSVTIPSTCKEIGASAFYGCTNLTSVTLNEGLTDVAMAAFELCPITELVIPSTVTSLSDGAFGGAKEVTFAEGSTGVEVGNATFGSATRINIPSIETWLGFSSVDDQQLQENLSAVANVAYIDGVKMSSIETVVIPAGTIHLTATIFSGFTSMTTVTIPSSVTSFGHIAYDVGGFYVRPYGVFTGCTSLTTVIFEEGFSADISYSTFSGCSSLANITIPNTVTGIAANAFYECASNLSVTIEGATSSNWGYADSETASNWTTVDLTNASTNATLFGEGEDSSKWFHKTGN